MIYFLASGPKIKIGTARSFHRRKYELRRTLPYPGLGELVGLRDGGRAEEQALHRRFAQSHDWGEWFYFTPNIRRYIRVHTEQVSAQEAEAIRLYMAKDWHTEGWGPGKLKAYPTDTSYIARHLAA